MKKTLILALVALVMAATSVNAQPPKPHRDMGENPTPEQMAQKMATKLTGELNLSPEQEKQVYAVQLEQMKRMAAHRETMSRERQNEDGEMQKILSAEQYDAWKEMMGPRPRHGRDCEVKDCQQQCPLNKRENHHGDGSQGKRTKM